jgi:sulfur-oxidizing protein SoxY
MNRREFFTVVGGAALALTAMPSTLKAGDYRKMKPDAWTAHKVNDAVKALYGASFDDTVSKNVKIKAAKVASSGAKVKVKFSVKTPAKTVAFFQDANPESAVAVFEVGKYDVMDYQINLKMGQSGSVYVVAEGLDGKLYSAKHTMDVAAGGCEG